MQELLIVLATQYPLVVYVLIAFFACPVGPMLSILLGVLLHQGYFSLIPVYTVLMIGDLIGDTVLYYLGYKYGYRAIGKFGKYLGITEKRVEKASVLFHRYKDPVLFISKITNGFGLSVVTLLTAGIVRIPFLRYLAFNMLGQFVWTGALLYVGYTFGGLYDEIDTWNGRITIIGIVIVAFILGYGYRNYRKKKHG